MKRILDVMRDNNTMVIPKRWMLLQGNYLNDLPIDRRPYTIHTFAWYPKDTVKEYAFLDIDELFHEHRTLWEE